MAQDYPVSITLRATKDGSVDAVFQGTAEGMRRFKEDAEEAARGAAAAGASLDGVGRAGTEAGRGARDAGAGMREAAIGATGLRPGMQGAADAARALDTSARGAAGAARDAAAATTAAGAAAAAATGEINGVAVATTAMGAASAGSAAAAAAAAGAARANAVAAGQMGAQTRLAGGQVQQLTYQLNDIVTMLAMGASPFQILASQGGQVVQVFGGIGATFRALLGFLTPVVVGALSAAAAVGALTVAALGNASSIRDLDRAYARAGETSGYTREAFERLAHATAETAGISVRSAREIGAALLETGGLAGRTIAELSGLTETYAKVIGADLSEAAAQLGEAFADPIRGAQELDDTFGFLSVSQQRDIRNLVEQGEKLRAQSLLASELDRRLKELAREGLTETASWWDRAASAAGRYANAALEALDTTDRRPRSVQLSERLETAENRLEELRGMSRAEEIARYGIFGSDRPQREAEAEIRRLRTALDAEDERRRLDVRLAEQGRQGEARRQLGLQAQPVIDAADPVSARRGEITREITLLNRAIGAGAVDAQAGAQAIALLRKEYADLRDPLEKVGKAYGDALRGLRDQADAQERLAQASAGGTAAVREAEIANEAHAFALRAATEGWASYEAAYSAAAAQLRRGDIAETTTAFHAWVAAQEASIATAEAMAAATAEGGAAIAEAAIQTRLATELERLRIAASSERAKQIEALIRDEERLKQATAYNVELQTAEDALTIAQAELAIAGEMPEVRDAIITRLREELRLKAQFPELSEAERDRLLEVLETTAAVEAQTKRVAEQRDLMLEPLKNAVRGIQDAFAGAFRSIFSGGVDSFKDLGRRVLDIMIETAAQIAALMVFRPRVEGGGGLMSMLGGGSAGAPAAGGGAGGFGLSDIGRMFSTGGGGSISPGLDAWAQGALGFGQIASSNAAGMSVAAAQAGGLSPMAFTGAGSVPIAAPGLLNGGSALAGFSSLSNVLGIAGAVLPGLISGNYVQAAAGGIGAAIGTVLLPGIGTAIGGFLGNLAGGFLGPKEKMPQVIVTTQAPGAADSEFAAGVYEDTAFGRVGLGDQATRKFPGEMKFVEFIAALDKDMAQFLTTAQTAAAGARLQAGEGAVRHQFNTFDIGEEGFLHARARMGVVADSVFGSGVADRLFKGLAASDEDSSGQNIQEMVARFQQAASFLNNFDTILGELSDGMADFGAAARQQGVDQMKALTESIGSFDEMVDTLNLSSAEVDAAKRQWVEVQLGLRDAAEPASEVEQALEALRGFFSQATELAASVGLTEADVQRGLERQEQELRDGFIDGNRRAILAITDPMALALEDFEKLAEQRLEDAQALGVETVLIERRNALERNALIEQLHGQALSGLRSLYDDLLGGSGSPLAAETVLANAEARYEELRDAALAGDTGARDDLEGAARDLLDAAREMFASSPEYFQRFDDVMGTLDRLLGTAPVDPLQAAAPLSAPAPIAPVAAGGTAGMPDAGSAAGAAQFQRDLLAAQREAAGRAGEAVEEVRRVGDELAALREEMAEAQIDIRRLAGRAA